MPDTLHLVLPTWQVPERVHGCVTTRQGGVSKPPYDSLNLAMHVGDNPQAVADNRALLSEHLGLPGEPNWLEQVHGTTVADRYCQPACQADAFYTDQTGEVCAVLTADCLPVFVVERHGREVAVAHAGWRGLLDGVIEQTVARFAAPPGELLAWLGPAIGPAKFEVGDEVREAFVTETRRHPIGDHLPVQEAFARQANGRWLADIYLLARYRLARAGINAVTGGDYCTVSDEQMFYSYRRDGVTGRMASLAWLQD